MTSAADNEERAGVEEERVPRAHGKNREPAERGTDGVHHLVRDLAQRHGLNELFAGHDRWDQRPPGRTEDRTEQPRRERDRVGLADGVGERQQRDEGSSADVADHHHEPAIEAVGDHASDRPEGEPRDRAEPDGKTDGERFAGQVVDVNRQRDEGDERSGVGDDVGQPQPR